MATRDELMQALRAADKAGATDDARRLAAMLANMEGDATAPTYTEQVQSQFEALPWYSKAATAAGDMARIGGDAVSLGLTTKLAESLGMGNARQNVDDAYTRAGMAGDVAGLGAGMIPLMALPEAAPFVRGGPVARTLQKLGIGGAEGAAVGGVEAAADDEDVTTGQLEGAFSGILGQGAANAIGKGVNAITAPFKKSQRMTVDELRSQKDAAYNAVDQSGIRFRPQAVDRMLRGMDDSINNRNANKVRHPDVYSGRANVHKMTKGSGGKSLSDIDSMRQVTRRDVVGSADPASSDIGRDMMRSIDDFTSNVRRQDVIGQRDPDAALEMLDNARNLNQRYQKLSDIDERLAKADRQAAKSLATGEDTTIKNNINSVLDSPRLREGYTPDELAKMEEVVRGSPGEKLLRQVGRMAPGGGLSWPAAAVVGGATGAMAGPFGYLAGLTPMAIGQGAKKLSERATRKSAEELADLIASGGNMSKLRKAPTIDERSANALARLLMLSDIKDQ